MPIIKSAGVLHFGSELRGDNHGQSKEARCDAQEKLETWQAQRPNFYAVELGLQVAVFLFYHRPGALHQRGFEPMSALAQAIGSTLAGTLIRCPDIRQPTR